jgi:two-component system sensor histidine kinase HydH
MRSDGNAELSFTDTGMGLSPMELDELRRFIPGKSAKPHGSGYGLPTAQRRIAEHGGSLTINSVEDKGTTIVVMLPPDAEDGA